MMSQFIGDSIDSSVDELVEMLSSQETLSPNRRSQVTRIVAVPTSEHVAQIVGKSGIKIKNLRAATQTCIKTPLRNDEPVFTISGPEANVDKVVKVIQQASDHFTRLMESRSNACAVGEVTIQVPVPQQYVGVVVGRNGSVIMRIKEQTRTRINTPKGDSQTPAFEVTGSQINVMAAKEAIEDKVRQAIMLKDSTAYDPDLSHKTKALNEAINWPSCPPLSVKSSNMMSFNFDVNDKKSSVPLTFINEWSPSGSLFQRRAMSPVGCHFNQFMDHSMSPRFDSNMNSFQF